MKKSKNEGFQPWQKTEVGPNRIYIPLGYTEKESFRGRTKFSEGQLFTFRDHQHVVCRAQRGQTLLMIKEREKFSQGKFCSSKKTVSFSSIPSEDTFFCCAGGCPPPVQKLVNRSIYRSPSGCPQFSNNINYGCPYSQGSPARPAIFQYLELQIPPVFRSSPQACYFPIT